MPPLRSLKKRNGDEYYQHFAPNGAKTAHLFLNLAPMRLAPLF